MTTMTTTDADRVRQLLAAEKTVQQTADLTGLPRAAVLGVLRNTKGWLHDSARDVAYRPADADEERPADSAQAPVEDLLAAAAGVDDKTVQRELARTTEQIARLRDVVATAQERTAAAREVAVLKRKLAEAEARLKNAGTRRRAATGKGPAVRAGDGEVRAWAKENGIECNSQGRVPKAVREQYDAAHGAA